METLVRFIRPENFGQEVISEKRPVLVLCMPRDDEFPKQLKVIQNIAAEYRQELKVGILAEEFIEAFKKSYSVVGTPTFLLMVEGKERARMLGLADREMLMNLISQSYR